VWRIYRCRTDDGNLNRETEMTKTTLTWVVWKGAEVIEEYPTREEAEFWMAAFKGSGNDPYWLSSY
jgi:hypothetical protein